MNDSVLIAAIAGLPATIASLAALWKTITLGRESIEQGKENVKVTERLDQKTTEIHTATNSHLDALTKALAVANEKISGLEALVATMTAHDKVADVLPPPR
jgi:hypothetical protein